LAVNSPRRWGLMRGKWRGGRSGAPKQFGRTARRFPENSNEKIPIGEKKVQGKPSCGVLIWRGSLAAVNFWYMPVTAGGWAGGDGFFKDWDPGAFGVSGLGGSGGGLGGPFWGAFSTRAFYLKPWRARRENSRFESLFLGPGKYFYPRPTGQFFRWGKTSRPFWGPFVNCREVWDPPPLTRERNNPKTRGTRVMGGAQGDLL